MQSSLHTLRALAAGAIACHPSSQPTRPHRVLMLVVCLLLCHCLPVCRRSPDPSSLQLMMRCGLSGSITSFFTRPDGQAARHGGTRALCSVFSEREEENAGFNKQQHLPLSVCWFCCSIQHGSEPCTVLQLLPAITPVLSGHAACCACWILPCHCVRQTTFIRPDKHSPLTSMRLQACLQSQLAAHRLCLSPTAG